MASENGEDSPVTFKQAKKRENITQDEEGHSREYIAGFQTPGVDVREDLEDRADDLRTILEATPRNLFEETETIPGITPPGGRIENVVNLSLPEDVANELSFDQLTELLEGLPTDISNLSQQGLLALIAQLIRARMILDFHRNQIGLNQLEALYDILAAVEPFRAITVSGINEIEADETNEVVPVIPRSDEETIPTRKLFIKASDSNSDLIVMGDNDIQPANGWFLEKGESIGIEFDLREATLYMVGEPGDQVELLGVV